MPLHAGQPNPDTFPYENMSVTLKSGETISFDKALFQRSLMYDLTVCCVFIICHSHAKNTRVPDMLTIVWVATT